MILTFLSFALFPVAIIFASNFAWLIVAYVIGGLREIGEPSRKAMIVDLATTTFARDRRALLSRSQSFDHSGSRDRWIALEDCAASAVRYCRSDRTGWNSGLHHDCRGTLRQLGTQ